jgi:hypothetical protein
MICRRCMSRQCASSEASDTNDQLQSDRSGAGGETMVRGVRANQLLLTIYIYTIRECRLETVKAGS